MDLHKSLTLGIAKQACLCSRLIAIFKFLFMLFRWAMKLSASYNLLRASLMTRSTAASGSSFRMANATFCEGAGGKPSMVRAATASSSISECPVAAVAEVPETIPGYIGAARIVDETTARSEIQVPGVGSRDGVDYQLEERDGVLWINAKGSLYMDAAAAPTLFTGSGASYTTIQADGYARWYLSLIHI